MWNKANMEKTNEGESQNVPRAFKKRFWKIELKYVYFDENIFETHAFFFIIHNFQELPEDPVYVVTSQEPLRL